MFSPQTLPKILVVYKYYKNFKTSNLIISNNASPSTGLLDRTNVAYLFKYPLCMLYFRICRKESKNLLSIAIFIIIIISRHSSLSFIALGRSSGQNPVSSHSCWMYVRAGRPAFAGPCVGIHKSTSLMSSYLLLQQCPACLVRLTWIVFVIGGKWPYSWCLVGCCCQDLFRIARSILV